jgi:two-component system, NtrC family, response regulator AtoC
VRGVSTILIAEQDFFLRQQLADCFRQLGHEVVEAGDGLEASQELEQQLFEVILADLDLPERDGFQIFHASQAVDHFTPVVILADPDGLPGAIEALKLGAHDYLIKHDPIRLEEVQLRVERALDCRRMLQAITYLKRVQPHLRDCDHITRHSVHLRRLLSRIQRDIDTSAHVLITGEPGSGKGVLAAAIHANSPRRDQTLVAVDCAALSERALESELFGHAPTPFRWAQPACIGSLDYANRGTLFLHHIGNISPRIQSKLLRVLQDHTFERVGSSRTITVDVRVVAATSSSLTEAIGAKRFRSDLYARLTTITVEMPALRDYPEDILPLAHAFLMRYRHLFERRVKRFDETVERALVEYPWPGNLRELESAIAYGVAREEDEVMRLNSLSLGERRSSTGESEYKIVRLPPNGASLKAIEREALLLALQRTYWVQKDAAAHLDISPRVMHYKLKTHGIAPPRRSPRR